MSKYYIEDIENICFIGRLISNEATLTINDHKFTITITDYIKLCSQINMGYLPEEYKGYLFIRGENYYAHIVSQNYWLCGVIDAVGLDWDKMDFLNGGDSNGADE